MERNKAEEIKNAIGMIDVRLKNIENTLATVEMSEDIREALCDEKEELEVYRKSLQKKTPEEYIDLIGKLQDELHWYGDEMCGNNNHWSDKSSPEGEEFRRLSDKCDELERQIKQTYDEFFTTYPERKVMCWYCGEQGHLLNPQGMCSWCASK